MDLWPEQTFSCCSPARSRAWTSEMIKAYQTEMDRRAQLPAVRLRRARGHAPRQPPHVHAQHRHPGDGEGEHLPRMVRQGHDQGRLLDPDPRRLPEHPGQAARPRRRGLPPALRQGRLHQLDAGPGLGRQLRQHARHRRSHRQLRQADAALPALPLRPRGRQRQRQHLPHRGLGPVRPLLRGLRRPQRPRRPAARPGQPGVPRAGSSRPSRSSAAPPPRSRSATTPSRPCALARSSRATATPCSA